MGESVPTRLLDYGPSDLASTRRTQRRFDSMPQEDARSKDLESQQSSATDIEDPATGGYAASSRDPKARRVLRWQRKQTEPREDLEPGSEYYLTHSRTPKRDPNYHDPAIWPDDLVDFDSPTDPANPRNWPLRRKVIVTLQLGFTTMGASFASSSFSPTFASLEQVFHISRTVATLSLSLFVLGLYVSQNVSSSSCRSLTRSVHLGLWSLLRSLNSMDAKYRSCRPT